MREVGTFYDKLKDSRFMAVVPSSVHQHRSMREVKSVEQAACTKKKS